MTQSLPVIQPPVETSAIGSGSDRFKCAAYACILTARSCVTRQEMVRHEPNRTDLYKCKGCKQGEEVARRSGVVVDGLAAQAAERKRPGNGWRTQGSRGAGRPPAAPAKSTLSQTGRQNRKDVDTSVNPVQLDGAASMRRIDGDRQASTPIPAEPPALSSKSSAAAPPPEPVAKGAAIASNEAAKSEDPHPRGKICRRPTCTWAAQTHADAELDGLCTAHRVGTENARRARARTVAPPVPPPGPAENTVGSASSPLPPPADPLGLPAALPVPAPPVNRCTNCGRELYRPTIERGFTTCSTCRQKSGEKHHLRARALEAQDTAGQHRSPGTGQVFRKGNRWYAKAPERFVEGRRYAPYVGSYDTPEEAHSACDEWVTEHGVKRDFVMPTCSVPGCGTQLNERALEAGEDRCGVHRRHVATRGAISLLTDEQFEAMRSDARAAAAVVAGWAERFLGRAASLPAQGLTVAKIDAALGYLSRIGFNANSKEEELAWDELMAFVWGDDGKPGHLRDLLVVSRYAIGGAAC